MNNIERPDEVVVVSRREWLRVAALAGAVGAIPGSAVAQPPPPKPVEIPHPSATDLLNQYKSQVGTLNGSQGKVVPFGLIAAFAGLVMADLTTFDAALVGRNPTIRATLSNELGLDPSKWENVATYAQDTQGTMTTPPTAGEYQAMRDVARAFWQRLSSTYDPGYRQGQDGAIWQLRTISMLKD